MRRLAALLLVLATTLACDPYRYEKRGEDLVRIHRRTGETYILRKPAFGGQAYWAKVLSPEEVTARDAERQRAQATMPAVAPTPTASPTGTPRFYRPSH